MDLSFKTYGDVRTFVKKHLFIFSGINTRTVQLETIYSVIIIIIMDINQLTGFNQPIVLIERNYDKIIKKYYSCSLDREDISYVFQHASKNDRLNVSVPSFFLHFEITFFRLQAHHNGNKFGIINIYLNIFLIYIYFLHRNMCVCKDVHFSVNYILKFYSDITTN